MSTDVSCPSPELLRRSLDPDDPMPETERRRIDEHLDHCDRGCKQVIETLLRGNTLASGTAETRWKEHAGPRPADRPIPVIPGYEILGELGRGGMAIVYQARQVGLNRVVALKMVRAGAHASAEEIARFRIEAEAVAALRHPNIVQIYEIGTHDGCPYLALEFVEGGSLSQRRPNGPAQPRQAAELVETLARAVHFAHQQGIIHRDLKPANVLLAADGTPKVADFGLAKRLEGSTDQTRTGEILGTPNYMAPEQATAGAAPVGTPADVYALGAILYTTLTGRPPFQGRTPLHVVSLVQSAEPAPPRRLNSAIPADLETICLKCLQKDPQRRYASAAALADDLHRFRTGEPITARPVSAPERVAKWVRRRPAVAGLLTALSVLAVGSVVGLTALYVQAEDRRRDADEQRGLAETRLVEARAASEQARRETGRAETQAKRAGRVLAFLTDRVLAVSRPKGVPGAQAYNVSLLETLDAAVPKIADAFADSPEDEATVCITLADTYRWLGQNDKALPLYERALTLWRRVLGPDHAESLAALNNLAGTQESAGRYAEAEALWRECLAARRRVSGPDHPATLGAMGGLAGTLKNRGRYAEAESLYRECVAARRRVSGPEHPDTLADMSALAGTLECLQQFAEAEAIARETLPTARRVCGPEAATTLAAMHALITALNGSGRSAEAEPVARELLAAHRKQWGPDNPATLSSMHLLASALAGSGRPAEALGLRRECLAAIRRVWGPDHPAVLATMHELATTLASLGRLSEAEALHRECLDVCRRILGPEHPHTLTALQDLAFTLDKEGRPGDAVTFRREYVSVVRKRNPPDNARIAVALLRLGSSQLGGHQAADAEAVLRECLTACRQNLPKGHWQTAEATSLLGDCLLALGRADEAEPFLLGGYEDLRAAKGAPPPKVHDALERLVCFYACIGRWDLAEDYLANVRK